MKNLFSIAQRRCRRSTTDASGRGSKTDVSVRKSAADGSEKGQALLETVMSTGFLVAIAIAMNKMLRPVIVEAFEKIAAALSSVGP